MVKDVFCIHDDVANRFAPDLWVQDSEAIAVRNFDFAISQPGIMQFSPNDFSLYKVGSYDDEKGLVEPIVPIVFIKKGVVNEK